MALYSMKLLILGKGIGGPKISLFASNGPYFSAKRANSALIALKAHLVQKEPIWLILL